MKEGRLSNFDEEFVRERTFPRDILSDGALYEGVRMKRILGFFLDALILLVLTILIGFIGMFIVVVTFGGVVPLLSLLLTILPIAYHTIMIASQRHSTFGMRAMGIRVVSSDGGEPSLAQAAGQTIIFYVSIGLTNFLILLVSLFNGSGRCLHDYVSGCVIINEVRIEAPQLTVSDLT